MRVLPRVILLGVICLAQGWFGRARAAELGAHDYAVEITVSVTEAPSRIVLNWVGDTNAIAYTIARKRLVELEWTPQEVVSGASSSWTDLAVTVGEVYEYQIVKNSILGPWAYGYVTAAIRRSVVEQRGRLLLVVEESLAGSLAPELLRLQQDLVGDGWTVVRRDVSRSQSVTSVKALIQADYDADPENTKSLFLFGNVPVPRSGDIAPDLHPDHQGAWPADVYYGEFTGAWTDKTVTRTNNYTSVPNVPGDGKFDQSEPLGLVRLQIGRVDLSRLTCFANKNPARYEVDLARQYLNKDHHFRHGKIDVQRRGLIYDNGRRGLEPEPQACTAWRSFPGFFGRDQIEEIGALKYLPMLATNSAVWSYVRSTGSAYHVDWVASSDDWALHAPKVVFTSFLGSYMGEWDKESGFLRAPLGTGGYTLTSIYGGQPQWILHPMALGESIGYSAWLTQNNRTDGLYPPHVNAGAGQVHIALMGDPTLRMHPVAPAPELRGKINAKGILLEWAASPDPEVVGYHAYKAQNVGGPFVRISGAEPTVTLAFLDSGGAATDFYMVRALKLELTPSGSYYNLSQGAFYPDTVGAHLATPATPAALTALTFGLGGPVLEWVQRSAGVRAFEIQRRLHPDGAFAKVGEASEIEWRFADVTAPASQVAYRMRALGVDGASEFTPEVVVNLQPATATIVGVDTTSGGNWIGKYGGEGYVIPFAETNAPAGVILAANNATPIYTLPNSDGDPETLLRPDGNSRLLSEWRSDWRNTFRGTLELKFRFADAGLHRVAIYMVDYHGGARTGRLEVHDPYRNRLLQSISFANYTNGQYLNLELRNFADVRIVPTDSKDITSLSGLFFGMAVLAAPTIEPATGTFSGRTTVSIQAGPGVAIRYTMDGTEPTLDAPEFTEPFTLRTNAVIAAKAFKAGFPESESSRVALTNDLPTEVRWVGVDSTTQGDWKNKYGGEGNSMWGQPAAIPDFAEISFGTNRGWTWSETNAERRAINLYTAGGARLASCWYADEDAILELALYTNALQQVALYFMDWEGGRSSDVSVSDSSGKILIERRLEEFGAGKYLVFVAKGTLQIRVRRISGVNALINGIFIGGETASAATPALLFAPLAITGGEFTIRLSGEPGRTLQVQSTEDFRTWIDVAQRIASGNEESFALPWSHEPGARIFRVVTDP